MGVIAGRNRSRLILVLLFMCIATPGIADSARGADLYANHCNECHDRRVHFRGKRIQSLDVLRAWVDAWSVHAELDWTDSDTDDVTEYLNGLYYQFNR